MKYFDRNTWLWMALAALFFLPFLGGVHLFDWDEINFAELAREMYVTGEYFSIQLNFQPFTEKPPLFFWLQALSMALFGVGEYAARFPNAVLGIIVLPFLYISGKFLLNRRFGFLWAASWFGSVLPFFYFRSGLIDPWFNFLIFNGIFFLIHYAWRKRGYRELYFSKTATQYLWLAGISVGLAILAKGPVAYLLVALPWGLYLLISRFKRFITIPAFIAFSFIALLVFSLWFMVEYFLHGPGFIVEFTIRQWELLTTGDAGHSGFLGYHFVVLLLGCFPASIFALKALRVHNDMPHHVREFQTWMLLLFWVVLILFSLVGTKIIHYSSLAYYPLSFLSALAIWRWQEARARWEWWWKVCFALIGIIWVAACLALPILGKQVDLLQSLASADPFAQANLGADVNWPWYTFVPAILLLLILSAWWYSQNRNRWLASLILLLGMGLFTFSAQICFIGRVEAISQKAHVEFFESVADEEAYYTTYGFKSYVPYFYGHVSQTENHTMRDPDYLKSGEVDKPVYISGKIHQQAELEAAIPDAEFLYAKNGFVFYRRGPR